jgi:hypothetical protein
VASSFILFILLADANIVVVIGKEGCVTMVDDDGTLSLVVAAVSDDINDAVESLPSSMPLPPCFIDNDAAIPDDGVDDSRSYLQCNITWKR